MQTKVSQMNQPVTFFPDDSHGGHHFTSALEADGGVPTAALSATMAYPVASQRSAAQGLPFKRSRLGALGGPQDEDLVMQDRSNQIEDFNRSNCFSGCTPQMVPLPTLMGGTGSHRQ